MSRGCVTTAVLACAIVASANVTLGRAQGTTPTTTPPSPSPAESAQTLAPRPPAAPTPQDTAARTAMRTAASAHVADGDREHVAMHAGPALADYEQALAGDSLNYDALSKAARDAVDLGEFEPIEATRAAYYAKGLAYARRAVAVDSNGAEGHFHVARALGRQALSVGTKARIRYAKSVRAEALKALAIDPHHAGALHVMGVWNAEVMRLSGFERFIARNLLGGGILGSASWQEAVRYMEESVAADPQRIVHHLDLGKIYADIGETAKAREQFELVLSSPLAEFNDAKYQTDARNRLAKL
jgi:tetratricopeptide (TPR) repeat protein